MLKEIEVNERNYYKRIDKFIRNSYPQLKLGGIFKLIRKGFVKVNGKKIKNNDHEIFKGDIVSVYIPENTESLVRPEVQKFFPRYFDFDIIYEDDSLIVINKPPKISMHPGSGEQMVTVIEGLMFYADGKFDPHLVHRLDKLTSGVCVVSKTKEVSRELSDIIINRDADKYYFALVCGKPKNSGMLESVVDGKTARLEYKVRNVYNLPEGIFSLVDIHLFTGRKHQIRVQFSQINCPVAGDDTYGDRLLNREMRKKYGLRRFFLHAYRLKFNYKNTPYDFNAKLSDDLESVIQEISDYEEK
ncbi:MAG: RluA family pseudouridine synthase [Thermotogae bacterium]|nr:RluA family pseudouridine synthase [Thermotogota bacterium]MCP5465485.1 RluA family pseudouridine synthase [Thermotogota bacterium]HOO75319.1 RluA family pseudouridine synthase [Tepiditoga sp.]